MAKKVFKKGMIALIVIGCIVGSLFFVALGMGLYAHRIDDKTAPEGFLSEWMDCIEDDTLLKQVAIPGSHDAGTTGMFYMSETQSRSILDQLQCGSRYIDLRVGIKKDVLTIYHGPIYGMTLDEALSDLKTFLLAHPTETIIVDLQHFKDGAKKGAMELTERYLGDSFLRSDEGKTEEEFINSLTIGQARGKVIVYVGEDETDRYSDRDCYYKRNNDDGTVGNATLQSFYVASYNKSSAKKYQTEYIQTYLERYKAVNTGFFVLQGQLTDGFMLLGPKFRESQNIDGMNAYVQSLATSADLSYINIVLRDFVTPAKNKLTISLNVAKGNVKEDRIALFE